MVVPADGSCPGCDVPMGSLMIFGLGIVEEISPLDAPLPLSAQTGWVCPRCGRRLDALGKEVGRFDSWRDEQGTYHGASTDQPNCFSWRELGEKAEQARDWNQSAQCFTWAILQESYGYSPVIFGGAAKEPLSKEESRLLDHLCKAYKSNGQDDKAHELSASLNHQALMLQLTKDCEHIGGNVRFGIAAMRGDGSIKLDTWRPVVTSKPSACNGTQISFSTVDKQSQILGVQDTTYKQVLKEAGGLKPGEQKQLVHELQPSGGSKVEPN